MLAKAARRLLFFAFAISLLIHVVILFAVPAGSPNDENVLVTISQRHPKPAIPLTISRLAPTPLPKPLLTPHIVTLHPQPSTKPVAHVAVSTLRAPVHASTVTSSAVTSSAPVASASPTLAPRPCDAPAAIAATPDPPEIAPEVRAQMTTGIARVLVHLDAAANILDASITASTGNSSLDQVAISMARGATYLPARTKCKPTSGDYTFSARFAPW